MNTRLLHLLFILALLGIAFTSCKKDNKTLNTGVLPDEDVLNGKFSDTSTILAHTIRVDSMVSFNDGIKFIGSNQDPVFGRTDASLYTKFSLPNNITNVSFGNDASLIKAEIKLVVKTLDFLGDYLSPLHYQVFEMNKNINTDKFYFSNNTSLINYSNLLGAYSGTYSVENGTLVLSISVNTVYASAILTNPQFLLNNTVLHNTYKGFYITTATTPLNPVNKQGVITRFDLDNQKSGLFLYYQNGSPEPTKETKTFRFTFGGTNVVRFNEVKHKFNDGAHPLLTSQLAGDTTKGSQALFLKGLGGTKIKIHLPHLENFTANGKISVNRAEIRFRVDVNINGTDGKYPAPLKLAILGIDSLGRENYTYDQLNSIDFARYGGDFIPATNEYIFNISRDIQALMDGKKKNYGYFLVIADPDRVQTPRRDAFHYRIVLGGHENTLYKPMFRITYTPLN